MKARSLLLLAAMASVNALVVLLAGGVTFRMAGILVREHHPALPCAAAALTFALALTSGRPQLASASAWWWAFVERRASGLAAAIALAAVGTGAIAGTYVAGGSDSYCYLNQAELFSHGQVRELQPLAASVPWPDAAATFLPAGHARAAAPAGAIVPMCPPGYPLLMVPARAIGGRTAMFWVVPLMGGIAVWLAFVLGRMLGGAPAGVLSALLLAASPAFIYQIVQPMNDVPATALWMAALVVAWRASRSGRPIGPSLSAGLVAGFAVVVRPNLAPLSVVAGVGIIAIRLAVRRELDPWPSGIRDAAIRLLSYGAGVCPSVILVMVLQNAMYGGPLSSGYGKLDELFRIANVIPNLKRYPVWLLQTQTPLVALSLAAPFVAGSRESALARWWLLVFAAATLACYLPYAVFDAWWYLRFLLPALGVLLPLTSAAVTWAISRVALPWRAPLFALVCGVFSVLYVDGAVRGYAFDLRRLEARYREAGEYVAAKLPSNALVLTSHQSGSIRFYSGHPTVLWGSVDPGWLDRSLDDLRFRGYHPYFLFEAWEEPAFRKRFAGHSKLAGLEWPPVAEINRQVLIYDPADYEPYMRGGSVRTDRVWTKRP